MEWAPILTANPFFGAALGNLHSSRSSNHPLQSSSPGDFFGFFGALKKEGLFWGPHQKSPSAPMADAKKSPRIFFAKIFPSCFAPQPYIAKKAVFRLENSARLAIFGLDDARAEPKNETSPPLAGSGKCGIVRSPTRRPIAARVLDQPVLDAAAPNADRPKQCVPRHAA
jgi:hypothetical protein